MNPGFTLLQVGPKNKDEMKTELNKLIVSIFQQRPRLNYYQVSFSAYLHATRSSPFILGLPRHYQRPLSHIAARSATVMCGEDEFVQASGFYGYYSRTCARTFEVQSHVTCLESHLTVLQGDAKAYRLG